MTAQIISLARVRAERAKQRNDDLAAAWVRLWFGFWGL